MWAASRRVVRSKSVGWTTDRASKGGLEAELTAECRGPWSGWQAPWNRKLFVACTSIRLGKLAPFFVCGGKHSHLCYLYFSWSATAAKLRPLPPEKKTHLICIDRRYTLWTRSAQSSPWRRPSTQERYFRWEKEGARSFISTVLSGMNTNHITPPHICTVSSTTARPGLRLAVSIDYVVYVAYELRRSAFCYAAVQSRGILIQCTSEKRWTFIVLKDFSRLTPLV